MNKIQKAVLFAAEKHKLQTRKGTDVPYIVHPLGVMEMLMNAGASTDAIIAGILHDTIEDTDTTYDELRKEFGKRVADIVLACSEPDKSLPWAERKEHTIAALRKCRDKDVLAVIFADKAHNLQSLSHDYGIHCDLVWDRFNRGQEGQMWYYGEICEIAKARYKYQDLPLKSLMCEYWYQYDTLKKAVARWARLNGNGDERDYTPEEEAYFDIMAIDFIKQARKQGENTPVSPLEEYLDLSKKIFTGIKGDKISARIQQLKLEFTEYDWDTVIYSSPTFMRSMMIKQKKKYLKQKALLEQYNELSMKLGASRISKAESDKIKAQMNQIESKFTEQSWDKLIHSVPIFIRPMISAQKKKYLGK